MKDDLIFRPGKIMVDTDGEVIQAHSGGILIHDGVYYWFGENKATDTHSDGTVDAIGVSCYSSDDLLNWKNEGVVLVAEENDVNHDLYYKNILERPKVIYNEATKLFVMWMHVAKKGYNFARTGVAVSNSPAGPYRYIASFRPNGCDSRDMTVFKDDDGSAYLVYSSSLNSKINITRLPWDYIGVHDEYTSHFVKLNPHESREAPAVVKHDGKYYMVSSGCTGWDCNEAEYAVSDNMMGPWKVKGNPCIGEDADKTFYSQSTYILPVSVKNNLYIFMADRWNPKDLRDSRYVWLPLHFEGEKMVIQWKNGWTV